MRRSHGAILALKDHPEIHRGRSAPQNDSSYTFPQVVYCRVKRAAISIPPFWLDNPQNLIANLIVNLIVKLIVKLIGWDVRTLAQQNDQKRPIRFTIRFTIRALTCESIRTVEDLSACA
jgi:hypothetical protein